MSEGPGEERANLIVGRRHGIRVSVSIGCSTVVAKEGGVSKYVPAAADMHGVTEVTERRADHVRGQVTFEPSFPLRLGDQALQTRQLSSQIHTGAYKDNGL